MLFAARTGLGFQFQTLGSVSPDVVEALSISYQQLGMLIGLFSLAGVFLAANI
jgi:hypothetical protein